MCVGVCECWCVCVCVCVVGQEIILNSVNFTVSDFLKCYLLFCVKLAVIYIPSLKSMLLENFTNRLLSIRLFRSENLTSQ